MDARRAQLSTSEVALEAGSWMVGLGVISMALFPFALPALVLALVLVLPALPLALVALVIWLLARILRPPLRFVRTRFERPQAAGPRGEAPGRATASARTRPAVHAHVARRPG